MNAKEFEFFSQASTLNYKLLRKAGHIACPPRRVTHHFCELLPFSFFLSRYHGEMALTDGQRQSHPGAMTGTFSFTKKVVVVTGAARGLGCVTAMGFARAGAKVVSLTSTTPVVRKPDHLARRQSQPSPGSCDWVGGHEKFCNAARICLKKSKDLLGLPGFLGRNSSSRAA